MTTPTIDVIVPLDDLLRDGGLHCAYQPFVDLESGAYLAHEALLRGPAGTSWESPMVLLGAARDTGRLLELEAASLRASLADAAAMYGGQPMTLFVNVEPSTLCERPDIILDALAGRAPQVQVVVEITERALAADLAGIVAGADKLRAAGCAIALDDVGIEPESQAFIPILRPEVIKLDLALLRSLSEHATVVVAGAVRAYAQVSGAEVVAEGVETPEDLTRALVLGATLGQGWFWGHDKRRFESTNFSPDRFAAKEPSGAAAPGSTPFDLVASTGRPRNATLSELVTIADSLEAMALTSPVPPVLLANFAHARRFDPSTAARFETLAARLPFVCALGVDMPASPAAGVRGAALSSQDRAATEWTVVVVGAHATAALIAREVDLVAADGRRQFQFVVTTDRAIATAAAHSLISRTASTPTA